MAQATIKDRFTIDLPEEIAQLRAVARPIWYDQVNNALRAIIASGTVTTVSTVTNQTQMGGVDAKTGYVDFIERSNWALTIRGRIA